MSITAWGSQPVEKMIRKFGERVQSSVAIYSPCQKTPVTIRRTARGSVGCSTASITPFWQTATGGGVANLHCA